MIFLNNESQGSNPLSLVYINQLPHPNKEELCPNLKSVT